MHQLVINEDWRSIDGYINYQVSNIGRVRNSKTGKALKQHLGTSGYYALGLFEEVERKYHAVHQLVAHVFLENPDSIHDHVIDIFFSAEKNICNNTYIYAPYMIIE